MGPHITIGGILIALGLAISGWLGVPSCATDLPSPMSVAEHATDFYDCPCCDVCDEEKTPGASHSSCSSCAPAALPGVDAPVPEDRGIVLIDPGPSAPLNGPSRLLKPPKTVGPLPCTA